MFAYACVCVTIVSAVAVVSAIERRLPLQQISANGVISSRRRRRLSVIERVQCESIVEAVAKAVPYKYVTHTHTHIFM